MTHPLTTYRKAHDGMTLEQAAALFGITKPSVWRIENGQQLPSPPLAQRISSATNIPLWELRPDIWKRPENGKAA